MCHFVQERLCLLPTNQSKEVVPVEVDFATANYSGGVRAGPSIQRMIDSLAE
jgi:hypothetical protein